MAWGAKLRRLQGLDSERDAKSRRLAEIESAMEDRRELRDARDRLKREAERARRWVAKQRDLELEIESLSEKMSRSEKRLYGGKVKSPKELSDLQAEIGSLRRRRQKLEDALLETMISREEAETEHEDAQSHLGEVESHWSARQEQLKAEQETLESRIGEIEEERRAVASRIDAEILRDYERVRERKGGQAVAQIRGDTCSACGVSVAPSMEWKLRQGELVHCDTCGRILIASG